MGALGAGTPGVVLGQGTASGGRAHWEKWGPGDPQGSGGRGSLGRSSPGGTCFLLGD